MSKRRAGLRGSESDRGPEEGRVRRLALARVAVAALVSLVVAPAAVAAGDNTHTGETVVARFKWSVTGSMGHTWSITSTFPCDPVGSGLVEATFTATSRSAFKVVRGRNEVGTTYYNYDFDPATNALRGRITKIDNTTQNPPEFEGSACRPTDESGCGTRALKDGSGFLQDVSGQAKPLEFQAFGIRNAFSAGDCEDGGFEDFGRVNLRDLPKLYPGVPSPKKLAQRRKRFTLTVHRRDSRNNGADVQSRTLAVTFTPLR